MRGIPGDSVTVEPPSGLTSVRSLRRAVTTADSSGFELVTTIADSVRVNGRLPTATWTRSTNETVTTSAEGRQTTTSFDALGHLVSSEFPGSEPTVLTRDSLGRLTDVDQGARSWTYAYDSLGRVERSTDPLSRAVEFEYDAANRVSEQTFPDSSSVRFGYDAAGRLDSLVTLGDRS